MIVPRLTCPWVSWVQKAPSIQTVVQTLDSSGRSRVPDRRRWPCGRSTRACFAAVTTWPPSGVKKLSRSGPSCSTSRAGPVRPAGPARRRSGSGRERRGGAEERPVVGNVEMAPGPGRSGRSGAAGRPPGRPGPPRRAGRRRPSWRAGWSARNTPKNPVVQVAPGCEHRRLGLQRHRAVLALHAGPGQVGAQAGPRRALGPAPPGQLDRRRWPSGGPCPRHPTSSQGVGPGMFCRTATAVPWLGDLDRGEVEVLADVVLVGAHRARRAPAPRPARAPGRPRPASARGSSPLTCQNQAVSCSANRRATVTVRSPTPAGPVRGTGPAGSWDGHRTLSKQRDGSIPPGVRARSQRPPGPSANALAGKSGTDTPATSSRSRVPLSVRRTATSEGFGVAGDRRGPRCPVGCRPSWTITAQPVRGRIGPRQIRPLVSRCGIQRGDLGLYKSAGSGLSVAIRRLAKEREDGQVPGTGGARSRGAARPHRLRRQPGGQGARGPEAGHHRRDRRDGRPAQPAGRVGRVDRRPDQLQPVRAEAADQDLAVRAADDPEQPGLRDHALAGHGVQVAGRQQADLRHPARA